MGTILSLITTKWASYKSLLLKPVSYTEFRSFQKYFGQFCTLNRKPDVNVGQNFEKCVWKFLVQIGIESNGILGWNTEVIWGPKDFGVTFP